MKDRRAVRSDNAIREAFLTLLAKKCVNNITVTEISDLANIGRGTFYLHYKDPYDLLEKIEDEVIAGINECIHKSYNDNPAAGLMSCAEKSAEYMLQHKDLCKVLLTGKGYTQFIEKLSNSFVSIISPHGERRTFQRYYTAFLVSGAIGLLHELVKSDMEMSPQEIAQIVKETFENIGRI